MDEKNSQIHNNTNTSNKCKRCGSTNLEAQVSAETHFKQGHGCLFTVLFGWAYWSWLAIKWCFKYMIAFIWYIVACFYVGGKFIYYKATNSENTITGKDWTPAWLSRLLRRHGKAYTEHKSMWVCQDCGNIDQAK